jgi:hypothetical protein
MRTVLLSAFLTVFLLSAVACSSLWKKTPSASDSAETGKDSESTESSGTATQRMQTTNNLKQIALAMHIYHDSTGTLPAVANFDAQGKPLLSWRVLILPYIEEAQLYNQFKMNEPWDSPHNKALISRMPKTYANPANPKLAAEGKTCYLAPVHLHAVFTGNREGIRLQHIVDGTSNTIMLVEAADSAAVIWTKPEDLQLDQANPQKGLGTNYARGTPVAFADGFVTLIPKTTDKKDLWALFTRDGGEPVKVPDR